MTRNIHPSWTATETGRRAAGNHSRFMAGSKPSPWFCIVADVTPSRATVVYCGTGVSTWDRFYKLDDGRNRIIRGKHGTGERVHHGNEFVSPDELF